MICTDFQGLVSAHDEPSLAILLVLQESHITSSTFLPLTAVAVELEQLGAHLEGLLLRFFVGLGLDLLSKMDDWLEVNVWGFVRSIILFRSLMQGTRHNSTQEVTADYIQLPVQL